MKKSTKLLVVMVSIVCLLLVFTGCEKRLSESYTFEISTGDRIEVELDRLDGFDLTPKQPFQILKDDQLLSEGTFVNGDAYQQYVDVVESDNNAELLDSGTKDGNEYIFWCYNGSEYDYAILVANSNTCVLIGNQTSEESAEECFNRLIISVDTDE